MTRALLRAARGACDLGFAALALSAAGVYVVGRLVGELEARHG